MKIYYDKETDYQALINRAVKRGDLFAAARYERQRNQKIRDLDAAGENIWKATQTDLYSKYLKRPHAAPYKAEPDGSAGKADSLQTGSGQTGSGKGETSAGGEGGQAADPFAREARRLLDRLTRRETFSYDTEEDPLYDLYQNTYRRESDRARRDTLADLASQAGGMNSHAYQAAQQQSDYHLSQLADRVPQLYQLAYELYKEQGDSLLELLQIAR